MAQSGQREGGLSIAPEGERDGLAFVTQCAEEGVIPGVESTEVSEKIEALSMKSLINVTSSRNT